MRVLALRLCLLPSSLFAAAQGYDQALAALKAYTADPLHRSTEGFEDRLNNLASQLANSGKTQAAVTAVQINAETHPTSWQTFDSLGVGYQLLHDNSRALAAYQRSLELNPSNAHAKTADRYTSAFSLIHWHSSVDRSLRIHLVHNLFL